MLLQTHIRRQPNIQYIPLVEDVWAGNARFVQDKTLWTECEAKGIHDR